MQTLDKKFLKIAGEIDKKLLEAMEQFRKARKCEDSLRIKFPENGAPLKGCSTMLEAWEEVFKATASVKVAMELLIEYTKNGEHTK